MFATDFSASNHSGWLSRRRWKGVGQCRNGVGSSDADAIKPFACNGPSITDSHADALPPEPFRSTHPSRVGGVALAPSDGRARGVEHLGAPRVLEAMWIPVGCVVRSSMGGDRWRRLFGGPRCCGNGASHLFGRLGFGAPPNRSDGLTSATEIVLQAMSLMLERNVRQQPGRLRK